MTTQEIRTLLHLIAVVVFGTMNAMKRKITALLSHRKAVIP